MPFKLKRDDTVLYLFFNPNFFQTCSVSQCSCSSFCGRYFWLQMTAVPHSKYLLEFVISLFQFCQSRTFQKVLDKFNLCSINRALYNVLLLKSLNIQFQKYLLRNLSLSLFSLLLMSRPEPKSQAHDNSHIFIKFIPYN